MVNHWNTKSGGPIVTPSKASERLTGEIRLNNHRLAQVEEFLSENTFSGIGKAIARVLSLAPDLSDQEGLEAFARKPEEICSCQHDLEIILSHAGGPNGLFEILPARGAIFLVGLSVHLKGMMN